MERDTAHSAPEIPDDGLRSSLHALLSARIAIIRQELKLAAKQRLRAIASLVVASILVFFTWALFLAGSIAAIAMASGWPWHLVTLGFAVLHLLVAGLLVVTASNSSRAPSFPVTSSEFKKDCEWLEGLQNKKKSND